MTLWNETKSVPVSKEQVWLAYKKVRSKYAVISFYFFLIYYI
jgi:hypothetical protein